MNLVAALAHSRLFAGLPDADLRRLAAMARLRRCPAGTLLVEAGRPCDRFYLVASGRVKVFRTNDRGREQILHLVHPGESFAEAAMFGGEEFPASAETLEASDLVEFPARPFRELLLAEPELALRLLAVVTRWLRRLVDLVNDLSLKDVQGRLAGFLLREAAERGIPLRRGGRIPLGIAKNLLARRLGTAAETLSRVFLQLQKEGVLRVHGGDVEILSPTGLRAAAAADSEA